MTDNTEIQSTQPSEGAEKLNILKQFIGFGKYRMSKCLSHTEVSLYFTLLYFANLFGRKEWFELPNTLLCSWFNITTLQNTRNKLIDHGLIEYKKGKRGNSGKYKFVLLYDKNEHNSEYNPAYNPAYNSEYNSGQYSEHLNKNNKNKNIYTRTSRFSKKEPSDDGRLEFDLDAICIKPGEDIFGDD